MKKVYVLSALLVLSNVLSAVVHSSKKQVENTISLVEFVETSNKELEKKLSVNLSWKEKLSLWLMKKKLKKTIKKNPALANQKIQLDQLRVQEVDKITEGWGIMSLIFGILSLLSGLYFVFLAVPLLSLLGLIFGIVSVGQIKKYTEKYKGLGIANAGIYICGILLILSLLLLRLALGLA